MLGRRLFRTSALTSVLLGGVGIFSGSALAQEPSAPEPSAQEQGIADIVVTAERRAASVQTTPIAIAAIGGDDLQARQLVDIEKLSDQLANVNFARLNSDTRVFIRGIGIDGTTDGADPRVALYSDGVYQARSAAALGTFFDVERVEVVAGPQGTLYGRNATAGAINIISRDPTATLDGYGTITFGNHGLVRTEGAIGGPLSESVSARISFQTNDHNGYGRNIQTGTDIDDQHTRAVRAKVKLELSPAFSVMVQGDYFKQDDNSGGYHFIGNTPGNQLAEQRLGLPINSRMQDTAGIDPVARSEAYGGAVTATLDLGGPELTSISGYRVFDGFQAGTPSGGELSRRYTFADSKAFTQELRLAGKAGILDYLVGAYYFYERNSAGGQAPFSGLYFGRGPALLRGSVKSGLQHTNAYAVFTQTTLNLTDELGVDFGLRYSYEKRRLTQFSDFDLVRLFDPLGPLNQPVATSVFVNNRDSWSSTDPKVTVHYQATPTLYLYATYSRGFKSGGFNLAQIQRSFNPEHLTNYELGVKADLFDRRLRANISAFRYDYTDLQVTMVDGTQSLTQNAAASRIYGLEGNFTVAPTDALRLDLNLAYLDAKFRNYVSADPGRPGQGDVLLPSGNRAFNLVGNHLSQAPKFKAVAQLAYTFDTDIGEITPRVAGMYVTRTYFSPFNLDYISQPRRGNLDLFLDFKSKDELWTATAFVRNATNKRYQFFNTVGSNFFGYQIVGLVSPPLTFGASVTRRF